MEIQTKKEDNVFIFHFIGRMDISVYSDLDELIKKTIEEGEVNLLFDMADVEFLDSSGLRIFIMALKLVDPQDGQILIVNMKEIVEKVFEITNTTDLFNIFPSLEEAIESINA